MSRKIFLKLQLSFFLIATACGQLNYPNNQQLDGSQDGQCCENYCYVTDEEPYLNFATKTSYDSINRRAGSQHIVPDCTPVQFWSLNRHGTRLPSVEGIKSLRNLEKLHHEIKLNYEQRKSYPDNGRLCREDYDLFRRYMPIKLNMAASTARVIIRKAIFGFGARQIWHWNETLREDKADSLSAQGIEELRLLARRYKAKYSQILQVPYDERTFYFQYDNIDRAHDSYQAYIEGLFGSEAYKVHANTLNEDKVIRPEKCQQLYSTVELSYATKTDYERYIERPEYMQLVRDVFRRLGFRYSLNASIINDIYDMCRYEKAWYVQQRSPWCIAFTKNHLKMLEYAQDLKTYYKNGYGNQMSAKIGCGPVKDFYDRFEKTISGSSDGNRGTFYFANSATLQTVLTALGVAKDFDRPTADNYYQQSKRNWKTSAIDPFAGNLVAVLYQCRGSEKYKVMFFLNEIPVEFPECSVGLCNWSTIQQKYEDLVRTCNVNGACDGNTAGSKYLNYTVMLLCTLYFYMRF